MHCLKCGKQVDEKAQYCPSCGTAKVTHISGKNIPESQQAAYANDTSSVGLNVLSFLLPVVGLILFLTMRGTTPKRAKLIGISALAGFGLSLIVSLALLFISMFQFSNPQIASPQVSQTSIEEQLEGEYVSDQPESDVLTLRDGFITATTSDGTEYLSGTYSYLEEDTHMASIKRYIFEATITFNNADGNVYGVYTADNTITATFYIDDDSNKDYIYVSILGFTNRINQASGFVELGIPDQFKKTRE